MTTPYEQEFEFNIHEAGHGVVAVKFGVRLEYLIGYSPVTGSAGMKLCDETMRERLEKHFKANDLLAFRTHLTAYANAVIGGPVAQSIFGGQIDWRDNLSDNDAAHLETARKGINSVARGEAYYKCSEKSFDKMAMLLREYLSRPLMLASLRRIAAELKSRGQLKMREVSGLIRLTHGRIPEGLRALVG